MAAPRPRLALTLGDPAGVGPELVARLCAGDGSSELPFEPLLFGESGALAAGAEAVGLPAPPVREVGADDVDAQRAVRLDGALPLVPSAAGRRRPTFGRPSEADARSALAAIDLAVDAVRGGAADALVTLPVGKEAIARWVEPSFRGHTDHIAARLGAERYGRDYLMAFLTDELNVALLTTHLPLRAALDRVTGDSVSEALRCLHRAGCRRIALAGLNPHAGEGALLGSEEREILEPALDRLRRDGVEVAGPISPDTVFQRARRGRSDGRAAEFDWVLALYHDQGLIAIKTLAFGSATNWTLGLPILRTSVDHGTAYDLAGRGLADVAPLRAVVARTLRMLGPTEDSSCPSS